MLTHCNDIHWLLDKCKIEEIHCFIYSTKWRTEKKKDCLHLRDVEDVGGFYIAADVSRFTPCNLNMLMMFKNVLNSVYFVLFLFFLNICVCDTGIFKILIKQPDWNTGFKFNTEISVLIKIVGKYVLWILRGVLLICLSK